MDRVLRTFGMAVLLAVLVLYSRGSFAETPQTVSKQYIYTGTTMIKGYAENCSGPAPSACAGLVVSSLQWLYRDPYYGATKYMAAPPRCDAAETATANPTCDGTYVTAQGNKWFSISMTRTSGCPANSYPSASITDACQCETGFLSKNNQCLPDCTKKGTVSSGFFDIGTSQGGQPKLLGCKDKCEVVFDGVSPAGSTIENGVKHWYAKGEYVATGGNCPAATPEKPDVEGGQSKMPSDTCGPGEAKGSVNGKPVCIGTGGEGEGKQTDGSKDKDKTTIDETTTTNPDGSVTKKKTTVKVNADGTKETTVETTTTHPDGSVTTGKEVITDGKPKSDGGAEEGEEGEDPDKTPCEKNSSGEGCGGSPTNPSGLYTPKEKSLITVLNAHSDAISGSGLGGAMQNFFSVAGGGACPTWSATVPFLDTTLTLDQFCTPFAADALMALKAAFLVAASFFAFRVAIE